MVFLKLLILILSSIGAGYAGLEFSNFSRYKSIYNKGVENLDMGNFSVAERAFKKVLEIAPDMEENVYNLALTYFYMNKLDLSLTYFLKTLDLNPKEIDACYNIGIINYLRNKKKNTIKYFTQALEISEKKDEQTLFSIGMVYTETQDYDMAIQAVTRLIELSPSNIDYRMMLADVYEKLIADTGNIQSLDFAIKTYKEILELDENYEPANIKIASCYSQTGDIENCQETCKRILKKNPQCADALYLMGIMSFAIKDFQNAINYFEQTFAAKPNMKQAYLNAAYGYQKLKNSEKAKELYLLFKAKATPADLSEDLDIYFEITKVSEETDDDEDDDEEVEKAKETEAIT